MAASQMRDHRLTLLYVAIGVGLAIAIRYGIFYRTGVWLGSR